MKSDPLAPILGDSLCMRELRRKLSRFAMLDAPVLVHGETGVGKELVARGLHDASARAAAPYVAVNCAAIPRDLVESELFGAVAGAFTGARARDGHFTRAHGGTLFLDEVGELPPAAQAALLRVLETGEVQPLGGDRARRVNVRIVSATHRSLEAMVEQQAFRLDLFHRLAPLVLEVPPLRARIGDLGLLTRCFLEGTGLDPSPAAMRRLRCQPWPGNVRELRNVLLRARAAHALDEAADFEVLDLDHLGLPPGRDELDPEDTTPPASDHRAVTLDLRPLREVVAAHTRAVLTACDGNVRAAARTLRVSPTTLYRHLSHG